VDWPTSMRCHPAPTLREGEVGTHGHASSRAALIYLHSTQDRQRILAVAFALRTSKDLEAASCGTSVLRQGPSTASDDRSERSRDPPEPGIQVARLAGIEPATNCLEGSRSIR